MYQDSNMLASIRKVEAAREENAKLDPRRMTAEEKETLLKKFHPDYRAEQFTELRFGPNQGQKVPLELAELLEGESRILHETFDLTKPDYETDVLIIGGGGAGCSAAIEADNAGAKVMVVTKLRMGDANTMMAEGGIQAADKPNDSPAQHFLDAYGGGHFAAQKDLLYKLVMDAPEAIQWLSELGVEFDKAPDGTMITTHGGGTSRKRMHAAKDYSGAEIMRTLRDEVLNHEDIQVVDFTSAIELIKDENGHCAGAVLLNMETKELLIARAKTVILATGGYARNKEMVARYPVAHYFSNVPHGNVGDGLTAAEKIGALNYEHPAVQVVYTSLTCGIGINDESGLIVNDRGERVVNEWSYQYTVSDAIARSGSNCGWYITSGKEPYGGVQYGYKSAVAGKSKDPCATSIEGLAKKMGCDPATLQATYDRYCELVEKGVDEDFGKPAEFLHPIKGPKFVALRMHPCVTVTFGGLETDVSARVMKPDGSVIPHLYAAGEVAGTGMYGTQYPTCGTSIGSALFYGRIAGRAVTDQALL